MKHRNILAATLLCLMLAGCVDERMVPHPSDVWQQHIQRTAPDEYGVVCYRFDPDLFRAPSLSCVKVKP